MTAARYAGPLKLGEQGRRLVLDTLAKAQFAPEGPLSGNEYRELSVGETSDGRIGIRHVRAIKPLDSATGWHWHDMDVHVVFVLKGRLTFRFQGVEGDVVLGPGDCISQPAGVPHNVIDRSADLELLEITLPQRFNTADV
jgi:mannose-6-phosphate isomerase-like protein (cupin superfamily)